MLFTPNKYIYIKILLQLFCWYIIKTKFQKYSSSKQFFFNMCCPLIYLLTPPPELLANPEILTNTVYIIWIASLVKVLLGWDKYNIKGSPFEKQFLQDAPIAGIYLSDLETLIDIDRKEWTCFPLRLASGNHVWTWIPTFFATNWQVTSLMGKLASEQYSITTAILIINSWFLFVAWVRSGSHGFCDMETVFLFVEASQLFLSPFMKIFVVRWAHYYLLTHLGINGYKLCETVIPPNIDPPNTEGRWFYLALKIIQIYEIPYEN